MAGKHSVSGFKAYTSYVTHMNWREQERSDVAVPRDMVSSKLAAIADIDALQAANWLRHPESTDTVSEGETRNWTPGHRPRTCTRTGSIVRVHVRLALPLACGWR